MKQLVVLGLISAFLGLGSVSFAEDACCPANTETQQSSEPTAQVISEDAAVVAQEGAAQENVEAKIEETASVEAE